LDGMTPRIIVLDIPELPNMKLGANGRRRLHYQVEARLVREAREEWYSWLLWAIRGEGMPQFNRAKLSYELTFPTRRLPDPGNVEDAVKPITDTLCGPKTRNDTSYRLGVLVDDDSAHLEGAQPVVKYQKGISRTVIRIEELLR
jgi:hypothetical protein